MPAAPAPCFLFQAPRHAIRWSNRYGNRVVHNRVVQGWKVLFFRALRIRVINNLPSRIGVGDFKKDDMEFDRSVPLPHELAFSGLEGDPVC